VQTNIDFVRALLTQLWRERKREHFSLSRFAPSHSAADGVSEVKSLANYVQRRSAEFEVFFGALASGPRRLPGIIKSRERERERERERASRILY